MIGTLARLLWCKLWWHRWTLGTTSVRYCSRCEGVYEVGKKGKPLRRIRSDMGRVFKRRIDHGLFQHNGEEHKRLKKQRARILRGQTA